MCDNRLITCQHTCQSVQFRAFNLSTNLIRQLLGYEEYFYSPEKFFTYELYQNVHRPCMLTRFVPRSEQLLRAKLEENCETKD